MVLGGVLAVLVAQIFGKNAKTDAFFAAYGVYAVGLTFAQTFRLTAVSRLVRAPGHVTTTRLLGAVVVISVVIALPMVVLAGPLGRLLVTTDPHGIAVTSLRILWIALLGQLLAAMLATALAVRGSFAAIGIGMLPSGIVSIGTFLLVRSDAGVTGAAIGLAAAAVWLTIVFGVTLLRTGWRPTRPSPVLGMEMGAEAGKLTYASATFIGTNVAYVVCVAVAARVGRGETTLFAYAYVLASMLLGVTANVTAMVRSPALLASSNRAEDAAAAGLWSLRFTLVLVGPVVAMVMLIGKPVVGFALGSGFHGQDITRILLTLLCLVGWILASAAGIFAVVELLARSELRRLAGLSVALVLAVTGLAAAASSVAGIEGIAGALSLVTIGVSLVQMRWAFGARWRSVVAGMLRATRREMIVLVGAFAPSTALLLALGDGLASYLCATVLAALLVMVGSRVAWPREWEALLGVARRSSRLAAAQPQDPASESGAEAERASVLRA